MQGADDVTGAELRAMLAVMPEDAPVTLRVAALRQALDSAQQTNGAGSPAPPEPLLTVRDVAALLRTSERWVYDHAEELGVQRLSPRCLRFPAASVARLVQRRGGR